MLHARFFESFSEWFSMNSRPWCAAKKCTNPTRLAFTYSDSLRQAYTRLQNAMRWSVQTCTLQGRRPSKRMKHLWLLPLIRPGIAAPQPPTQCTLIWFPTRNGLVWTVFGLVVDLAAFAVHMSMLIPVACPFEYHGSGTEGTTHICILSILDLIYKLKNPWLHPSCIKNQLPRVRKQPCCMVRHRPLRFYMQKPALYHEYWKPPSCFHQGMAWQHDNRVKQRGKEKERSEWERGKKSRKRNNWKKGSIHIMEWMNYFHLFLLTGLLIVARCSLSLPRAIPANNESISPEELHFLLCPSSPSIFI